MNRHAIASLDFQGTDRFVSVVQELRYILDRIPAPPDECRALRSAIQQRCFGRVRDLRLELRNGGLVLRGQAPSYYVKQLAQQAVIETGSLPIVANEIAVPYLHGH